MQTKLVVIRGETYVALG